MNRIKQVYCSLLLLFASQAMFALSAEPVISYARDIRPLLIKHCVACHGPDHSARQANLRLDSFRGATLDRDGVRAIVPGDLQKSELVKRITCKDAGSLMPPPAFGKPLSPAQIELLSKWVASGGRFETHWAFVQPLQSVPTATSGLNVTGPIDAFVSATCAKLGLLASPLADRYTVIRRAALDLTGLPPTSGDIERFLNDSRPNAYSRMIDRLLASPDFGERWARAWLDLARYADTNGYEKDRPRSIWPYRDWVINAINDDLSYDQFSIAQLAGDLLPSATLADRIATGFHRNTMLNEEGGIDPLEFRYYAMVDRVMTTATVWTGLTIGCAQCHSHKFDPISHEEYFQFMALLNDADEPELRVVTEEVQAVRQKILDEVLRIEAKLPQKFEPLAGAAPIEVRVEQAFLQAFEAWLLEQQSRLVRWYVIRPDRMTTNLPKLEVLPDLSIYSTGDITKRDLYELEFDLEEVRERPELAAPTNPARNDHSGTITGIRIEALPDDRLPAGGPGRCYYEGSRGDFFLSEVNLAHQQNPLRIIAAEVDYGKLSIGIGASDGANVFDGNGSTGWSTSGREGKRSQLVIKLNEPIVLQGTLTLSMLFERHYAASLGRFRVAVTTDQGALHAIDLPVEVEAALRVPRQHWDGAQEELVRGHFLRVAPELAAAREPIDRLLSQLPAFPTTLVMESRRQDSQRPTYVHHRGEYLSPREPVTGGLPAVLQMQTAPTVNDRLSLARWLVSEANPLAGRVLVNRTWQALFGSGFVNTPGDLGTQSQIPTHPELLDWLAVDVMKHGWSTKRLLREITHSHTYRQEAAQQPTLRDKDPVNQWLTRGPRLRLEAEVIRDQALAVSGLLTRQIGGPSVKPPQPSCVTELAFENQKWEANENADRFRRSLYTFSKRTIPFAAYQTFDAPSGESCTVKRERSCTPIQSLSLLNDAMYLEAARELGRVVCTSEGDTSVRISRLWSHLFVRPPSSEETSMLTAYMNSQNERISRGEISAWSIVGQQPIEPRNNREQVEIQSLAVWILAARALLNLDEAITKP